MPSISLYEDEDDAAFWQEHAYVRLRPNTRLETEPEEIILGNRIWFGSVSSQDDIFEGRPTFCADPHDVDLNSIVALAHRQMLGATAQEVQVAAQKMFAELSDPEIFEHRSQALFEKYGDIFRQSSILSLFRDPAVQRNWHEYAAQGAGYGAVFDFREPWQYECAPGLNGVWAPEPVIYVPAEEPPVIEIQVAPVDHDEAWKDIEIALLTKSDEWANQREERLFRVGIGPGHVTFPPSSLRAILLGYNCADATEAHIVHLCQNRREPLPVFQVQAAPPSRRLAILRVA